jgi:hypothetical protein
MKGEHRITHRPMPQSSDAPCRLTSRRRSDSDTATPFQSTTSALCRQKCIRRHHAPRDRMRPRPLRQNSPNPLSHRVDKSATLELARKNNLADMADMADMATSADSQKSAFSRVKV